MTTRSLKKIPALLLFLTVVGSPLPSLGRREAAPPAGPAGNPEELKEYPVVLEGSLRLVGNEPFSSLVLSAPDGRDYIIDRRTESGRRLLGLQGREVSIKGRVRESAVYAGRDRYLGQEYRLSPSSWTLLSSP